MTDPSRTAQTILARLGELRAGKLPLERQSMLLPDLEPLARAYLATTGSTPPAGTIYVSHAAAVTYSREEDLGTEEARRELTELLIDAKPNAADPTKWRARKRSTGVDITARIQASGRLLIVTSIDVRDANVGGRRGR